MTNKYSIKNDRVYNHKFDILSQNFVQTVFCQHDSILSALI